MPADSCPLLFASLSFVALLAANAEKDPWPKLEADEPKAGAFCKPELDEPKRPFGASVPLLSNLPPLPNIEVEDGLAAEPKALPDFAAKPPNPDPLEVVLLSELLVDEPNAPNAEPELGCALFVVFDAKGEDIADPDAGVEPKAEVEPKADALPKPDDEPKAGADV